MTTTQERSTMKVSIEDFKKLPIISGSLNLKWALLKLYPDISFEELISRLDVTYRVKYLKNLEKVKQENPGFDEDLIWQFIPQYKMRLDEEGLSIFLVSNLGPSHGFLFSVDSKNKKLKLLNP